MNRIVEPLARGHDLVLPGVGDCLGLAETLDCGQAFRWAAQPDGSYRGIVAGKPLRIAAEGDDILLCDTTLDDYHSLWRGYFDLDRDYRALGARFAADPVLREAMGYAPGIRVLRQPLWETVCTFIISANNNIPRIRGIVERLCTLLGEPTADGRCSFPLPEQLAGLSEDDLAPLRCGYRAGYLLDAARRFATGEITAQSLSAMDTDRARAALLSIRGVGPKVADCTLLFGLGRVECFPLDTWMKKVMTVLYPAGLPDWLSAEAGLAQQYLFHYARHHAELFRVSGIVGGKPSAHNPQERSFVV